MDLEPLGGNCIWPEFNTIVLLSLYFCLHYMTYKWLIILFKGGNANFLYNYTALRKYELLKKQE